MARIRRVGTLVTRDAESVFLKPGSISSKFIFFVNIIFVRRLVTLLTRDVKSQLLLSRAQLPTNSFSLSTWYLFAGWLLYNHATPSQFLLSRAKFQANSFSLSTWYLFNQLSIEPDTRKLLKCAERKCVWAFAKCKDSDTFHACATVIRAFAVYWYIL